MIVYGRIIYHIDLYRTSDHSGVYLRYGLELRFDYRRRPAGILGES